MRIGHATDIHWFAPPPWARLSPKRMLGAANLYLRGRRSHFQQEVQASLVDAMVSSELDAALITGDLTAQALPEEFAMARAGLDPLLHAVPTLIQAGNHDVYTRGAGRTHRIRELFGEFMALDEHGLARFEVPGLTVVGLDPNRPHLAASGRVPQVQLDMLPDALAAAPAEHALVLALHYPVVDRHGGLYNGWEHGLRNAEDLADVLRQSDRVPDWIVHGHVHHGYRGLLNLGHTRVPTYDPGSGGYAFLPDQDRAACFNVYVTDGPSLVDVERYRYTGQGFEREPGGAYASGR